MSTPQIHKLAAALQSMGIQSMVDYVDGNVPVDLYIPQIGMYVLVEPSQIMTGGKQGVVGMRPNFYIEQDEHSTFRITADLLETNLEDVADKIAEQVHRLT